ncbi:MAG: zinc-ribbon domain-containing protein [bacterium]|nr:zinc-ribbon domain-containing protein [bacterium]
MKRNSTFKYVFWGLLILVSLLVIAAAVLMSKTTSGAASKPLVMMVPFFIVAAAFISIVGRLVFKDAEKRGMDPWLWLTVVTFVPNLIGVIIYLIVRHSVKGACTNCGKAIQKDFKICPYCGQNQDIACENCKKPVSPDWTVCPFCAHKLGKEKE